MSARVLTVWFSFVLDKNVIKLCSYMSLYIIISLVLYTFIEYIPIHLYKQFYFFLINYVIHDLQTPPPMQIPLISCHYAIYFELKKMAMYIYAKKNGLSSFYTIHIIQASR